MRVYLDYAATTPVKKEVLEAMLPFFSDDFGNPSSIHAWGQRARKAIDESRAKIAKFLNCQSDEIIFTGGGSEADNLAINGLVMGLGSPLALGHPSQPSLELRSGHRHFARGIPSTPPHVITSQFEHHAVLKTCQDLEKKGLAKVTYIRPNKEGIIEVEKIKKAIRPNTVLISIMYVNNEIGTIQPIREIGKLIEKENRNRLKENRNQYGKQKLENGKTNLQSPISKPISNFQQPLSHIYFHTDAVQATEYLPMNVDYLHIDMLTIAGHKIGTPKGVGLLYIRKGTPIRTIIHGGEQEKGLRAGTENVPYIVGLAQAIDLIGRQKTEDGARVINLRDYFIERVTKEIPEVYLNGSKTLRAPHIINFYFKNIEGESIVLGLDLEGVACSTGSACTSQALEPSHVIMSIFNDHFRAAGSVRFSLSKLTTKAELDFAIKKIKEIVTRLREISPYGSKKKEKREKKEGKL